MATAFTTPAREAKKEKILNMASWQATQDGILASTIVGLATLAATYKSKRFDKMTSISAKVSFPVMAGLGVWSYRYESISLDAMKYPEKWGIYEDDLKAELAQRKPFSSIPFHHKVLNYVYDHPFQLIAGLGVPLAAGILDSQKHNTHLTISQKIMHSRVFAQAGVITILLVTMGFREYMDKHGRYPEPSELAVENSEN